MPKLLKLITTIILCEGAGILGSVFTLSAIPTWYVFLNKPFFSPPNSIFAPVWTTLYFLMGISLYLIWQSKKGKDRSSGIKFFLSQLALNSLWSIIFFGGHSPVGGLVVIIFMWFLIFKTIYFFQKVNKTSAILLYPYLVWVSFATILNLSIVILNP